MTVVIASFVGLSISAPAFGQAPSAQNVQTESIEKVDLTGAGFLDFALDSAPLLPFAATIHGKTIDFSLGITKDGVVNSCVTFSSDAMPDLERIYCDQVVGKAHFIFWDGFEMPSGSGQIHRALTAERHGELIKPYRIVADGEGLPLTVVSTSLNDCFIRRYTFTEAEIDSICATWKAAGRPGLRKKSTYQIAGIKLATNPTRGDKAKSFSLYEYEFVRDKGKAAAFNVHWPQKNEVLSKDDGRVNSSISSNDYPSRALREEIDGGVELIVGYSRSGSAISCQPVSSTNTAYLANVSCRSVIIHTSFEFNRNAPSFDGLRYRLIPLRWFIPYDEKDLPQVSK